MSIETKVTISMVILMLAIGLAFNGCDKKCSSGEVMVKGKCYKPGVRVWGTK